MRRAPESRTAGALIAAVAVVAAAWGFQLACSVRGELSRPHPSTLIEDRRGRYLAEVPGDDQGLGYWPMPNALPDKVVQATLEAEDRHFFDHAGVYLPSIARALWQDLRSRRRVSGASTIAMQVARLEHPARRTLASKLREAVEALLLVHRCGHQAVLRQYLELAPYGNRVRGMERAARFYFDKPVEDLDWREASLLAALPQMPGRMSPFEPAGLARAHRRADRILQGLHRRGILNDVELAQALAGALHLSPRPHRPPGALHEALSLSSASRRGPRIERATLDLDVQEVAEGAVKDALAELASAGADEGAALVVDPGTGEVLASVGSGGYFDATGAGAIDFTRVKRSPGSALKPFIYGLALDHGLATAATELPDIPVEIQDGEGAAYVPENSGHEYLGPMLVRDALGNSRNIPALRLLSQVGVESTLSALVAGGVKGISFDPGRYGLGLALGDLPVTLEELVGLYGALGNGGVYRPLPRWMKEGQASASPSLDGERLFSADVAQLLLNILSDDSARRPTFSPGGPLDYAYAVAVKTGTSQGSRDAWAVAISDRLLVGVWIGRADAAPMEVRVTGASAAGEVAHQILDSLMPTREPQRTIASRFPAPAGFVTREICTLSGRLAGPDCPHTRVESFAPSTEPVETCPYHHRVAVDVRNGLRATVDCPAEVVAQKVALDLPAEYADWARAQRLAVAPISISPLCEPSARVPAVSIRAPRDRSRYLWDPDTPTTSATIPLEASVSSADEDIVWMVDGVPVARVGYPFEARWAPTPGRHTIVASLAHQDVRSVPITVFVSN